MRPLRFLVVDDNPQDRRLVVRELHKAYPDSIIFEAIDQQQLVEHIEATNYDLVITDYQLLWTDGIQVLQAIKNRQPNCPVIMFTGTGSEEVAVEAMKLGLDDYIIKNVKHLVRLRLAVHAVLEHAVTRSRANRLASRLDSLLSQLNLGVFTCDNGGRFLDMNQAMVQLLGCQLPADAYKLTLATLLGSEANAEEFLRRVNNGTESHEFTFSREAETKFYRLTARRIESFGEAPCIDGLVEDDTRRKQSEQEAQLSAVAAAQISMLSPREKDVLDEVVSGQLNKVIARRLDISEKTVEKHRSNLMKKLGIRSVPELVRLAIAADPQAAGRENPQ
jgi:FixJ family two-component response regulator